MPKTDIDFFLKSIRERVKNNWDLVIAISGEEGVGKSHLAITLAMLLDKNFDLERNISYMPTYNEVITKFHALPKYSVYVIDEAIRVLDKQNWAEDLQKAIRHMYATERKQNKITFLLMPRFTDLSERFRNYRVKIWIHILARGVACIYIRDDDKDLGRSDPWHFKDNESAKRNTLGRVKISERRLENVLHIERKTMNYWFDFECAPLPMEIEAKYNELVAKYKALAIAEEEANVVEKKKSHTLWFACLLDKLTTEYTFTFLELSKMCQSVERDIEPPNDATLSLIVKTIMGRPAVKAKEPIAIRRGNFSKISRSISSPAHEHLYDTPQKAELSVKE